MLFDGLDLTVITLVWQDLGGLLGLRLAAEHPSRFAHIVAANTGLPDGLHRLPEEWWKFRDFVDRTEDLPVGFLVSAAVVDPMPAEVAAAYDAPFPEEEFKAGARQFPKLVPTTPADPSSQAHRDAWKVLEAFEKPVLTAFSDSAPITKGTFRVFHERVPDAAAALERCPSAGCEGPVEP